MRDQTDRTRRRFLAGTGVALGTTIAGCSQRSSGDSPTADDAAGEGATVTESESPAPTDDSYAVEMAPMGEVPFGAVPERWMAYFSNYGDMGIALGQLDGLEALIFTENWPIEFYDYLPGVDVDFGDVQQLHAEDSIDKEAFYEIDADVHLFDPNFIARLDDSWDQSDFDEVAGNVGPIVGNSIRRRGEDWHGYQYYSLYDAFETIAEVFQERKRYEAMKSVHDEFIAGVQADLPAEDERPTVGLVSVNSDFEKGSFYVYPVHGGNGHKQYRDLGMRGAFDDHIDGSYGQWDYEQILEVDPDALLFQYGFSHVSTDDFQARVEAMREDPVGQKLAAVENDRLYRGGTSYQGPIVNLFQTEIAAKQFYPETFGQWNGLETLADEDARLFDHQRVADIVTGEL